MKITTSLTGPGERVVKIDGIYAGVIAKGSQGWRWTGRPNTFKTYSLAAAFVAEQPSVLEKVAERKRRGIRY